MKVVADTNVVVSALLWHGPSRQILDAARAGSIQLFTTAVLLAELQDVLMRPKFAERLTRASVTADQLVRGYGALAGLHRQGRLLDSRFRDLTVDSTLPIPSLWQDG
jgi:predicted nucleic acid-binding protein